jgi:hypothetical protein
MCRYSGTTFSCRSTIRERSRAATVPHLEWTSIFPRGPAFATLAANSLAHSLPAWWYASSPGTKRLILMLPEVIRILLSLTPLGHHVFVAS